AAATRAFSSWLRSCSGSRSAGWAARDPVGRRARAWRGSGARRGAQLPPAGALEPRAAAGRRVRVRAEAVPHPRAAAPRRAGRAGAPRRLLQHQSRVRLLRARSDRAAGSGASPGLETPPEVVDRAKGSLGPALAAIGDSLMWSTLRPVAAALGVTWVLGG